MVGGGFGGVAFPHSASPPPPPPTSRFVPPHGCLVREKKKSGVTDVHCLHVWSLTLGRTVMTAHIKATDPEKALASAHEVCEAMGVAHSTIQVRFSAWLSPPSCGGRLRSREKGAGRIPPGTTTAPLAAAVEVFVGVGS